MANRWKVLTSLSFVAPPLALRADRQYRALPSLPDRPDTTPLPPLSIIVPARNEAQNLRRLLPSLTALCYPGPLELIVVDDHSTDETAVIARAHGARVISVSQLSSGWLGKPHACHVGAQAAGGDWLLFTDADTMHASAGPACAVHYARQNKLDGLSLFLKQHTTHWLDQLALTAAFAGLFAGLLPTTHLLNGQYILLRRDVYAQSGGFSAVRHEPVEDLALGRHLFGLGYRVPILNGENAAQVQMYTSRRQLWQGLTRLGSGSLRYTGGGSLITGVLITAVMSPLITLYAVATRQLAWPWLISTWGGVVAGLLGWTRRFGSIWWAAFSPVGALLVQTAATWGLLNRLAGRSLRWKERRV